MDPNSFVKQYGINAVIGSLSKKVFPSLTIAQAALETGWGAAIIGNNLFGIKADASWGGRVISKSTTEYSGGSPINYSGSGNTYANRNAAIAAGESPVTLFRAYASPSDSFTDRTNFLYGNARYANAGVFNAATPQAQAQALQDAGYATDPDYAGKLQSIIAQYNLEAYDKKKIQCEQFLQS